MVVMAEAEAVVVVCSAMRIRFDLRELIIGACTYHNDGFRGCKTSRQSYIRTARKRVDPCLK